MTEFEAVKQYTYPDESQSLRVKQMTEIAASAAFSHPEKVAYNAELLNVADPSIPRNTFKFEPTRNNEGLRHATWTLNTFLMRVLEDGSLQPESHRNDWELLDRDRKLARVSIADWRNLSKLPVPNGDDSVRMYTASLKNVATLGAEEEIELAKTMEAGLFATQKLEGGKAYGGEELSVSQRRQYSELSQLGKDAFDHFYEANLGLVVAIAKKYINQGMDMLDLIQEGNLGLRHAIIKFDYKQGYKFSTYANNWIKQTIRNALSEQRRGISISDWHYQRLSILRNARDKYLFEYDRMPNQQQLSEYAGMPLKVVCELYIHLDGTVSLDQELNREGSDESLSMFLTDTYMPKPEKSAVDSDTREVLLRAITEKLTGQDRDVLLLRFYSHPEKNLPHDKIGAVLGVRRERVSGFEKEALSKLMNLPEISTLFEVRSSI